MRILLLLPFTASIASAQWESLSTGVTASFRGLSVVGDSVVWASGTHGIVIRSVDRGSSWVVDSIPGAARFDIRAVHARSALVAHAAATAGRIWRTTDGGKTWSLRYQATDTAVFLDAISFFDDRHGVALGDPMRARFLLLLTDDSGESWREAPLATRPLAIEREAAFAASGTALFTLRGRAWIASGGGAARVFRSRDRGTHWEVFTTPIISGEASQGIFSIAFFDDEHGVVVGGDYQRPDSSRANAAVTSDGGRHWRPVAAPPRGYRSGVAAFRRGPRSVAVTVGPSGSEVSQDGGRTWTPLDSTGFNAVQFSASGIAFAVGPAGRAARFDAWHAPAPASRARPHLTRNDR